MARPAIIFIFGCLAIPLTSLSLTARLEAKPTPSHASQREVEARRLNVIDYFNLLPSLGIEDHTPSQEKRQLMQAENHPIIDVRHDYLLVHPDSSPAEQIAVFRTRGKPDLIADNLPDYECDYNNFTLYRLQNGRLRDVTRQMLPMPLDSDRFLLKLPRFGTRIGVYRYNLPNSTKTTSPRHVFDLQWRKGRFVKVR